MTARQIRRAQVRREAKEIRRAQARPENTDLTAVETRSQDPHLHPHAKFAEKTVDNNGAAAPGPSNAQLAANRANAQLSTGPTSEAGKAICSLNAVKTGLTGRTILLPGDDVAAYSQLVAGLFAEWLPETDLEHRLVQSLADTEWRLLRIPVLEAGIYAIGRLEAADQFAGESNATVRGSLIEANVFLRYQRQLNNLSIQEGRLRRQREKDTAQLRQLQQERQQRAAAAASAIGSEFSTGKRNENAPPGETHLEQPLTAGAVNAPEPAALKEKCLANAA